MAHGVIPVISEFTGLKAEGQFLSEVNSLTFPVGRPDLAAQQVARLSADAGLRQRLSVAARVSQTGRYSFQGSIDAWRDALNHCLELPPQSGPFPRIPEELGGRLTDLGVPSSLQLWIRNLIGKPVLHSEPGSEWPTASGLMTADERQEIEAFGNRFES
jgi:hypothetical protein